MPYNGAAQLLQVRAQVQGGTPMSRVVQGMESLIEPPAPGGVLDAGERIKHLEFIQAIVARMAGNSFIIKQLTVTVATGLIGVAAQQTSALIAAAAVLPAVVFWGLDAYFLRQERLFRRLYDDVRRPAEQRLHPVEPFSLSIVNYVDDVPAWSQTLWSTTLLMLHGVVLLVVIGGAAYLGA
jgi:hypothetical protein